MIDQSKSASDAENTADNSLRRQAAASVEMIQVDSAGFGVEI